MQYIKSISDSDLLYLIGKNGHFTSDFLGIKTKVVYPTNEQGTPTELNGVIYYTCNGYDWTNDINNILLEINGLTYKITGETTIYYKDNDIVGYLPPVTNLDTQIRTNWMRFLHEKQKKKYDFIKSDLINSGFDFDGFFAKNIEVSKNNKNYFVYENTFNIFVVQLTMVAPF